MTLLHIAADGSGDFATVGAALQSISGNGDLSPVTFYIHNGIYKEQLTITRPFLTLIGESAASTVLTCDLYGQMPCADIGKLGTFRSYSCLIDAHDVTAVNLTFENSSGKGPDVGQALALYGDGDRLIFDGCRFLGGQDTLFTAPLPPREIEPDGFKGPKQHAPRTMGRHYYHNCYLEGDIDFVFGGATAYFENCEFHCKDIGRPVNSYVTAASTPEGAGYGYVMESCRFTGSCPDHSCYLGRPWREFARVVLLRCQIGSHIRPEGWHDWNKPQAHETAYFAEFDNSGPSSDMKKRPAWVKTLTPDEAACYTRSLVLGGSDHWDPSPEKLVSLMLEQKGQSSVKPAYIGRP